MATGSSNRKLHVGSGDIAESSMAEFAQLEYIPGVHGDPIEGGRGYLRSVGGVPGSRVIRVSGCGRSESQHLRLSIFDDLYSKCDSSPLI